MDDVEILDRIHKVSERVTKLETQGTTEDTVQEDYSQKTQWNLQNIIAIVSGWAFLIAYIIFNTLFH